MNALVKKYGTAARWVSWRLEKRNGKATKIPVMNSGEPASSTDPQTWATYKNVKGKNKGIVFAPSRDLLGIDLDKCLNEKGKLTDDKLLALLIAADTYTEVSPSGTGLHLYLALSAPLTLTANRHEHYEAYAQGRYFTVTEKSFGKEKEVRTVTPDEAVELLKIIGYPWGKQKTMTFNEIESHASLLDPLPDAKVLEGMFAASNGAEIRALYSTSKDTVKKGEDLSRTDATFLSHLAFWCQKDPVQMERIWLASPLGGRQKTQNRKDYRDRTIASSIAHCTSTYSPSPRGESETDIDELGLLYSQKGKVKTYYKNTENMARIINHHTEFKGTFRYDAYRNVIERRVIARNDWRPLEDRDALEIQTRISVLFSDFANIKKDMIYDAIAKVAYDHQIDSGADYLRSLVWDKESRLDNWLHHAYHTEKNEYHRTIGSNWMKGLVKRVMYPGCKFDYVLVLEGPQGIKKSTSLMVLAGDLGHIETTTSTESKDFFMQLLGNAIVEFAEGDTLGRTEAKRMKAIITVQIDKFRAPYGHTVVPHPRRCVFAMTTNQTEYLKDETGNRRWLPVSVNGHVDLEWITANREQLLAEAYHRAITEKETTWEFPEKEMQRQQNARRIQDPNAEAVANWYLQLSKVKRDEGITVDQAFREALHNGFSAPLTPSIKMGIADVLKSVLLLEKKRGMIGGLQSNRWYPTTDTPASLAEPTAFTPLSETF